MLFYKFPGAHITQTLSFLFVTFISTLINFFKHVKHVNNFRLLQLSVFNNNLFDDGRQLSRLPCFDLSIMNC